ncbi:MAG: hypothetical protein R3321_14265, partial [Nitrososphaeraceae archaeon]|nr:hypothetical protein [Nitrososphaeraceae archaeon]
MDGKAEEGTYSGGQKIVIITGTFLVIFVLFLPIFAILSGNINEPDYLHISKIILKAIVVIIIPLVFPLFFLWSNKFKFSNIIRFSSTVIYLGIYALIFVVIINESITKAEKDIFITDFRNESFFLTNASSEELFNCSIL